MTSVAAGRENRLSSEVVGDLVLAPSARNCSIFLCSSKSPVRSGLRVSANSVSGLSDVCHSALGERRMRLAPPCTLAHRTIASARLRNARPSPQFRPRPGPRGEGIDRHILQEDAIGDARGASGVDQGVIMGQSDIRARSGVGREINRVVIRLPIGELVCGPNSNGLMEDEMCARDARADDSDGKEDPVDRHASRAHHRDFVRVAQHRERCDHGEQRGKGRELTDDRRRAQEDILHDR